MPYHNEKREKKHIKCLFISKLDPKRTMFDFGILTDDYTYYECTIQFQQDTITPRMWHRLRYLFLPFQFTSTSDVMMTDTIQVIDPICYYLKILQEQIHFKLQLISKLRIPRRISSHHRFYVDKKPSKIRMADMEVLWQKIKLHEKCPWITQDVEDELKKQGPTLFYRLKFLRMALYYMLVKRHLYNKYKNSYGYRKAHNLLTPEEQLKEKSSAV